jgi:hypothetical protein
MRFLEGKEARLWAHSSQAKRRVAVIGCLVRYFGQAAAHPEQYVERDCTAEEFTRGLLRRALRTGNLDVPRPGMARTFRPPPPGWRRVRPALERLHGRSHPQRRSHRRYGRRTLTPYEHPICGIRV